jgi:glyoxylase-like metal-dependent hydrolase (beta-lactamase superfamily II)
LSGVTVIHPDQKAAFPYSNSALIEGTDTRVLIDVGTGERPLLEATGGSVDIVLLSHFHFDHIHGYAHFPDAAFMAGPEEIEVYSDPAASLHHHGYDRWDAIVGLPRPPYKEVAGDTSALTAKLGFQPIPINRAISEDAPIDLGGVSIQPIKTPGHTSGHYAFFLPEREAICSADIDCSRMGPWYANPESSVGEFIESIDRVQALPWKVLISGHRRPLEGKTARTELDKFKQVILQRTEIIHDFLTVPRRLNEISDQAFILRPDGSLYTVFWERVMVKHHLAYLMSESLIAADDGRYFRR